MSTVSSSAFDLRLMAPVEGLRVRLRHWHAGDLPLIASASEDRYVPLITTVPEQYTPAEGEAWLARQERQFRNRTGCPLAIALPDDDRAAGFAGINGISWAHRRASIGFWIGRAHRGVGLASDAVSLLPEMARRMRLIRLEALVEPDNPASLHICRKAGFTDEGLLRGYQRIGDRQRDMLILSMILT